MNRSTSLSICVDITADSPTLTVDVIAVAWHVIDNLPDTHPLRTPLIYAVWALEDMQSPVAASIVVGLLALT